VAGKVEMGVLVVPNARAAEPERAAPVADTTPASDASADAGRRYLAAVRDRYAAEAMLRERGDNLLAPVEAAVHGIATSTAREPEARRRALGRVAASVAHLVPRDAVDAYRAAVALLPHEPGFRLVVTGPRAPYSFCDAGADRVGTILAT
jgi:hypothetical protein